MQRVILTVMLVLGLAGLADASTQRCDIQRFTSNGSSRVLTMANTPSPVSAWLKITTTGSGTPSVAVNILGPTLNSIVPTALLCTMNASTTYCGLETNINQVQAVVTGCTGTCDLTVALCGVGSP